MHKSRAAFNFPPFECFNVTIYVNLDFVEILFFPYAKFVHRIISNEEIQFEMPKRAT